MKFNIFYLVNHLKLKINKILLQIVVVDYIVQVMLKKIMIILRKEVKILNLE